VDVWLYKRVFTQEYFTFLCILRLQIGIRNETRSFVRRYVRVQQSATLKGERIEKRGIALPRSMGDSNFDKTLFKFAHTPKAGWANQDASVVSDKSKCGVRRFPCCVSKFEHNTAIHGMKNCPHCAMQSLSPSPNTQFRPPTLNVLFRFASLRQISCNANFSGFCSVVL
jgi:hypothetical protein